MMGQVRLIEIDPPRATLSTQTKGSGGKRKRDAICE
jgi:hypothetical protein